jgi:hypothetical protein
VATATIGIPVGVQPILASGVLLWELAPDEQRVLTGYRLVKQQGAGSLLVEFHDGAATKFDVRPNVGSVKDLNGAIGRRLRG